MFFIYEAKVLKVKKNINNKTVISNIIYIIE